MRDERMDAAALRRMAPLILVGVLLSWLVVQNGALLLMVSWPAMPTVVAVARALLKVGAIMAIQMAPGTLIACGAGLLWLAARRTANASGARLQGVRHG
jgi:hypothetical protein